MMYFPEYLIVDAPEITQELVRASRNENLPTIDVDAILSALVDCAARGTSSDEFFEYADDVAYDFAFSDALVEHSDCLPQDVALKLHGCFMAFMYTINRTLLSLRLLQNSSPIYEYAELRGNIMVLRRVRCLFSQTVL